MNKKLKFIIEFLLIIAIVSSLCFIYLQYDNITALVKGLSTTSDELALKMNENRSKLNDEVKKYVNNPIIDITAEDEKKIIKGELTMEEVADKYSLPVEYLNDEGSANLTETETDKPNNDSNKGHNNEKAIEEKISSSISNMYALKAKYVSKLGELERSIYDEYTKLPEEEQNDKTKYKIVMKNINYVSELEKKCDNEVEKLLLSLEKDLVSLRSDTEIVKLLRNAYEEEKEVKKAYYLSIYNE